MDTELGSQRNSGHSYPVDLAQFTLEHWKEYGETDGGLPEISVLERLLSTCYQASLMREEERQITFRLVLAEPEVFPPEDGPPSGLHRLEFQEPRTFDEQELRRLSPAAPADRSLIGVRQKENGELCIWGLVHSGPRWLQRVRGGRDFSPPMPEVPVVQVSGPGRLIVDMGSTLIGKLEGGRLTDDSMDVFESEWLPAMFAPIRDELLEIHLQDRKEADKQWADLDLDVTRRIAQHMIRRIISAARNFGHGGTLVIVPPRYAPDILTGRYIELKHKFADDQSRRRYRKLITSIMDTLAEIYGQGNQDRGPVGWEEYRKSGDGRLSELDEAIFEMSHLIAGLMAVDGAAVMTQRYEVLGFGGEISGNLEDVASVANALDVEANNITKESIEGYGTRHRSAFRLCNELHDVLAIVISQDSDTRFIRWQNGHVTQWNQA